MALDQSVQRRPIAGIGGSIRSLGKTLPAALLVAGAVLLSIVVHYMLALDQTAPWLMGDELRYAEMAKSFLEDGRLLFREERTSFATAYPVLIAPAWAAGDVETSYELAKAINVVLMTLSAVVVALWTRRLASTVYALVAGGLVLLMPTFAYTGMLMMENAALPAFLLAAFLIALALERPTLVRQLLVFASIVPAAAFRVQLITLLLVYPTAIVLTAVLSRRAGEDGLKATLVRFRASLAIVVLGGLAYVAYKLLSGASLASGLAAYSTVGEVDYDAAAILRWSFWHAGELALSVGFIPAVAFGALLVASFRRGGLPTAADRAFVAVAASTTFWFVLQAAAYASRFTERIEERYMVYAAPLLLIALVTWVARALPRSAVSISIAAIVPMLLAMTIPFERLFGVPILADTFGLIPFLRLSHILDGGVEDMKLALAGGLALAAAACLLFSPRLARIAFPGAVAIFFLMSAYTVYGAVEVQSNATRASSGSSDPEWVDRALGSSGRAAYISNAALGTNPHLLWQTEFWNRSVRGVYVLETDPSLTYSRRMIRLAANGRLVPEAGVGNLPVVEPYVLTDPNVGITGEVVAQPGPLALIRVDPPLRIESRVDGVYADGWSGAQAGLSRFAPLPGGSRRMRVGVSREAWTGADVPGRVTISAGPLRPTESGSALARVTATREGTIHSGQLRAFSIPVPPAPFRIEVHVTPTFSPAQFGQPDTRQLGARITFAPESR